MFFFKVYFGRFRVGRGWLCKIKLLVYVLIFYCICSRWFLILFFEFLWFFLWVLCGYLVRGIIFYLCFFVFNVINFIIKVCLFFFFISWSFRNFKIRKENIVYWGILFIYELIKGFEVLYSLKFGVNLINKYVFDR